jgi:hypothetical protein
MSVHSMVLSGVALLVDNAGALVAGGYLGYRFGDKVEKAVIAALGLVKKL